MGRTIWRRRLVSSVFYRMCTVFKIIQPLQILPLQMEVLSDSEDNIVAISEDLVQSPAHKSAGISLVDFDGSLFPPLKLQEDLKNGCGGQLWPAGMVLSKYLLHRHREDLQDGTMLVVIV
jgi:hypothetical protein